MEWDRHYAPLHRSGHVRMAPYLTMSLAPCGRHRQNCLAAYLPWLQAGAAAGAVHATLAPHQHLRAAV